MGEEERSLHVGRDDRPFVISSEVEKSDEISPCALLSRDDREERSLDDARDDNKKELG